MRTATYAPRQFIRLAAIAVLVLVGFSHPSTVVVPAAQLHAQPLQKRVPFDKPAFTRLERFNDPRVITIKFREGTGIRLRGRDFEAPTALDLPPQSLELRDRFSLDDGILMAQVGLVNGLVASESGAMIHRLFTRAAEALEEERRRGERSSGKELADLNLYYLVVRHAADAASTEVLLDQLNALDIVEIAYAEAEATPADAVDIPPTTPDYSAEQDYLGVTGVNATNARILHGVRGQGIKVIDVERNWLLTHEDLPNVTVAWGIPWGSTSVRDHGTAVLGVLAAQDNGYGMIGIAPDATVGVASDTYRVANITLRSNSKAINEAAAQLGPGDVILVEHHRRGPDSGQTCTCADHCEQFEYVPLEWDPATFDAIQSATANRVIVVEIAGNGSMNLDAPVYQGRFDRSVRDSGAIIVGASTGALRTPTCWTNYGSRVDLHAWGTGIATLGIGDLAKVNGSDPRQHYRRSLGGTSGAGAIVAGVVTAAQGAVSARGLPRLFTSEMLSLLTATGVPQATSDKRIGRMPNLYGAVLAYVGGDTCLPITITETAETRNTYIPPFGRRDYCFTVSPLDAARAVKYVFDTCSDTNFDTILEVFRDPGVLVGSNNNGCGTGSRQSKLVMQLTQPGPYRVRVRGALGGAGDMKLRYVKLPPPIQTAGE
jgi:hypothetical protein